MDNEKLRKLIEIAVLTILNRGSDVHTDDGYMATVEVGILLD